MPQCKTYNQNPSIAPYIFTNVVPINCATCDLWNGKRCKDEVVAVNMNNPELIKEIVGWCQW